MDDVVANIRAEWSKQGVEVESSSANKARVRMPPYFQGINEFVGSLEEQYDVDVDLETSIIAGSACVVFTIHRATSGQHRAHSPSPRTCTDVATALCAFVGIASMLHSALFSLAYSTAANATRTFF